jgi:hypothetical protein
MAARLKRPNSVPTPHTFPHALSVCLVQAVAPVAKTVQPTPGLARTHSLRLVVQCAATVMGFITADLWPGGPSVLRVNVPWLSHRYSNHYYVDRTLGAATKFAPTWTRSDLP